MRKKYFVKGKSGIDDNEDRNELSDPFEDVQICEDPMAEMRISNLERGLGKLGRTEIDPVRNLAIKTNLILYKLVTELIQDGVIGDPEKLGIIDPRNN